MTESKKALAAFAALLLALGCAKEEMLVDDLRRPVQPLEDAEQVGAGDHLGRLARFDDAPPLERT